MQQSEDVLAAEKLDPGRVFMDEYLRQSMKRYPGRYNFRRDPELSAIKKEAAEAKRNRRARRAIELMEKTDRSIQIRDNALTYGQVS